MITSLGLSAFVVFVVLAFTVTVFAFAAVVLEDFAFAVPTFLERILLPLEDSFSRFPMVPAPSSFGLTCPLTLHSNIKTDSASAANIVDR